MKKVVSDLLSGVLQTLQALKEKIRAVTLEKDVSIIGCQ